MTVEFLIVAFFIGGLIGYFMGKADEKLDAKQRKLLGEPE